jgi:hypothetical protein
MRISEHQKYGIHITRKFRNYYAASLTQAASTGLGN